VQALEATTLRISEIFFSLQGETSRIGLPTVFIRLTGCPLRCGYCDTAYAFTGGESMAISSILDQVAQYRSNFVTVTGGEPLAQKSCHVLLAALCDAQYAVSLETSGALDLSKVDARVCKVMDIKTPGSGEVDKNNWCNLAHLTQQDEIKFVLTLTILKSPLMSLDLKYMRIFPLQAILRIRKITWDNHLQSKEVSKISSQKSQLNYSM